jgi:hypothetical protein
MAGSERFSNQVSGTSATGFAITSTFAQMEIT